MPRQEGQRPSLVPVPFVGTLENSSGHQLLPSSRDIMVPPLGSLLLLNRSSLYSGMTQLAQMDFSASNSAMVTLSSKQHLEETL